MKWNPYSANCPTRIVLDCIADKWAVLIIGLLKIEKLRFNALLKKIEGMSRKVLSQTLKRLERDGLLTRTAYPTVPVSVEYALTPLGVSLAESLEHILLWSERNINAVLIAQQAYDASKSN
ncbi:winged helix-turn-helix transcriptional regulator [Pseudomonas sp. Z18(2022)]|uniref:winged helix-turn-helix transcriptional regulator n=1 Tax=Pseudomonas sp. Z18(2022) TaxID=2983410 RepID=UPI002E814913|nr:helix-turn-helix domain-containing protein [Pseudomonas sp. Z18(2022)]